MNYIGEIEALYIDIETNPLSSNAMSLWFALMHVNAGAGWVKQFSVAADILRFKAGLSSSSFKRARAELREKGYIEVISSGSKSPVYEIKSRVNNTTSNVISLLE